MRLSEIIIFLGIPCAFTGFCIWLLQRQISKRDKKTEKREESREQLLLCIIKSNGAAIALGEATAQAVQRIPDAHCNGEMHAALDYAKRIKHEQKDFLTRIGVENLF